MKPLLKWAGGKSRIAGDIERAFGERCHGTYYEPFVGSAAVYLHRRDRQLVGRAVLSDVNAKLVETHRAIRDEPDAVIRAIAALPQTEWKAHYYEVRSAYNEGPWYGPEHAARFIWLNRAGFNGLYRENRHGQFNVPAGSYTRLSVPEPAAFWEVSRMLQGVELLTGGFAAIMERAGPNDQIYCDPPYVPLSMTACFTSYSKEPFNLREQESLARMARDAAARGARVVLSNHDVPVVREELYAERHGFSLHGQNVHRAISRNGADRKAVAEVIAVIGPLSMVPA